MGLIQVYDGPCLADIVAHVAGVAFVKHAGVPTTSYNLSGTLHLSQSGWLLLSVPNALARGVFSAMDEHGIELPPTEHEQGFNAHCTVMSPTEIEQIGGSGKIKERGKQYAYTLGRLKEVEPDDWPGVEKVWYIQTHSPELQALRRSYGLSGLPHGGQYAFHITVAVRRRGVLARNEKSRAASA